MERRLSIASCLCSVLWLMLASVPVSANESSSGTVPRRGKHLRAIDDINAIGTRNIGGHAFGDWYSQEHEAKIGRTYADALDKVSRVLEDPTIVNYVNRVGQNVVASSDARVPFTIKIIKSDEVNAFALPGGFLYVTTGLIMATQNEAELAAVMAHEIAHVAARHATRQMTRSDIFNISSLPLVFVGGIGILGQQISNIAAPLSMNRFSRGFESEADYLGVQYLYKAGYDPQALVTFFERIQPPDIKKQNIVNKAFSTHPQTADRIRKTQAEIQKILPYRDAYIVSTSEFDEMHSRLIQIDNRHDNDEPHRPVLILRRDAHSSDNAPQ